MPSSKEERESLVWKGVNLFLRRIFLSSLLSSFFFFLAHHPTISGRDLNEQLGAEIKKMDELLDLQLEEKDNLFHIIGDNWLN